MLYKLRETKAKLLQMTDNQLVRSDATLPCCRRCRCCCLPPPPPLLLLPPPPPPLTRTTLCSPLQDTTTKRTIAENEQMASELAWQVRHCGRHPCLVLAAEWLPPC